MKYEHIEVNVVAASSSMGSMIGDVIREVCILCLLENRNVRFTFNDANYEVKFNDIIAQVHKE